MGAILNVLRCALHIFSGKIIYNFGIAERLRALRYPIFTGGVVEGSGRCNAAFCESAALREKALLGASGLNSLSQSLTALTAPSGREPLARPGTLHFSGELSRHAKGPIPEGAVAVGDWGSWLPGIPPQSLLRKASSPKGERARPHTLRLSREVYRHAKGPIPEGAGTAIAVTGGV